MLSNGYSDLICEIDGNCISNHLIGIINIIINKFKIIRESLYPCNFPYCHPTIQVFLPWNKAPFILFNKLHFRCLRMNLALST